ncbi:hypothetical protein RJ640_023108 [Escallonia rubra]|uniref:Uncharacterized protein n=1 Tax=Escallonia rubra TaxID=112253 RepID=A0AA88RE63_9ASTE|nr:hypothetical protein RJ640_023108 [Escallonia rubra]
MFAVQPYSPVTKQQVSSSNFSPSLVAETNFFPSVDNALDKAKVLRNELLAVVHDEHPSHIELDVIHLLAGVKQIKWSSLRYEKDGFEFQLSFHRKVLDSEREPKREECHGNGTCFGHADAAVDNGQGLIGLVGHDPDEELGLGVELGLVGEALEPNLVEGVGGVADELAEEDLLVAVEGVDDQAQQLVMLKVATAIATAVGGFRDGKIEIEAEVLG